MFFVMKNRIAMYEISLKIVWLICMFYNMVFEALISKDFDPKTFPMFDSDNLWVKKNDLINFLK